MSEPLITQPSTLSRTDWLLIGVLVAVVLPLRVWLICNTEVTARDSIGYVRYALQFEQYSWQDVLLKNHQHPGYPLLVWLVSQPVRALDGATTPENMALSTQLVNFAAALVLILPMYLLGRQFFDRTVSFGAALLYQYLPISAQHLSDGISEPVYLVLLVSGLLQAVHALRDRSAWRGALCGLFTGLAYLTRPEGALILPAFGIVLMAMQLLPAWRCSWPRFFACGIATATTAALVGSIYVAATGTLSNKPTTDVIIHGTEVTSARTTAHLFAAAIPNSEHKVARAMYSGRAVIAEVTQGLHYVVAIPVLLGMLWSPGTLRRHPGAWGLSAYCAIHAGILIKLGMVASYVSDRHVMIFVLLGSYFAVFGLRELPRRLMRRVAEPDAQTRSQTDAIVCASGSPWHRSPAVWFVVLFVAGIAVCLPKATQRLHGNRAGNHEAGRWLAAHVTADENANIVDDHAWSHFFSGMLFQEGREPNFAADHPSKSYVVTTRSRDPQLDVTRQAKLAPDAKVVYWWPEQSTPDRARVIVHVQARSFQDHPWKTGK